MLRNCEVAGNRSCQFFQVRFKKYYRDWLTPYHLEDFQTIVRSKPDPYHEWDANWKSTGLPFILQLLDISKLPISSKKQTNKHVSDQNADIEQLRRRLGQQGLSDGVNPSILFMSDRELRLHKSRDAYWETSVLDALESQNKKRDDSARRTSTLIQSIKSNMSRMPSLIEKYDAQRSKQNQASQISKGLVKEAMEEARDRYGYYLDQHDPKFKKLLIEIQERERAERKQKKK